MKRLMLVCLAHAFVLTSTAVWAAGKAPLGVGNMAVKVDYLQFTDDDLDEGDLDSGVYVGIEGFFELAQNLYLGAEVGYIETDDSFYTYDYGKIDVEVTYVPVELNLKYAIKLAPQLVADFGAGISYNYAEVEASMGGRSEDDSEWLFGGQFFADLNYTFDPFFLGINAKYQATEEWDGTAFDNWRIGGQIGVWF